MRRLWLLILAAVLATGSSIGLAFTAQAAELPITIVSVSDGTCEDTTPVVVVNLNPDADTVVSGLGYRVTGKSAVYPHQRLEGLPSGNYTLTLPAIEPGATVTFAVVVSASVGGGDTAPASSATQSFTAGSNCDTPPPADADGDGVTDANDKCPATPAGANVDANGCSASQRDTDGDGVNDDKDKCEGTPKGTEVDANGCAVVTPPPVCESLSGAIFTTNEAGDRVNQNIYEAKTDVYLQGGPDQRGAHVPDGTYYYRVTDPSGKTVLSPTRTVIVKDGVFPSTQLAPFEDTPNNGGEYKVWLSTSPTFDNKCTKTDNFKVKVKVTPPPIAKDATADVKTSPATCEANGSAEVTGLKFATLVGTLDQTPGAHTATFKSVKGHVFSDGKDTKSVNYVIQAKLTGEVCAPPPVPADNTFTVNLGKCDDTTSPEPTGTIEASFTNVDDETDMPIEGVVVRLVNPYFGTGDSQPFGTVKDGQTSKTITLTGATVGENTVEFLDADGDVAYTETVTVEACEVLNPPKTGVIKRSISGKNVTCKGVFSKKGTVSTPYSTDPFTGKVTYGDSTTKWGKWTKVRNLTQAELVANKCTPDTPPTTTVTDKCPDMKGKQGPNDTCDKDDAAPAPVTDEGGIDSSVNFGLVGFGGAGLIGLLMYLAYSRPTIGRHRVIAS